MQVEIVNADKKIRYNFGDIWALVQPFYLFIIPFLLGRITVQFMSKDLADQVFICADVIIGMLLMYAGALIILEYKCSGIYQELKGKWHTKKLQRMLREYDLAGAELLSRGEGYVIELSLHRSKAIDLKEKKIEIPFQTELSQTDHLILDMSKMILYFPTGKKASERSEGRDGAYEDDHRLCN